LTLEPERVIIKLLEWYKIIVATFFLY
jgi:hypothetical protein